MPYQTDHSEMALTLNTKHQYLKYFEDGSKFDHLAAFAPTQNWESVVGYDVHVPFLKTAVYQYKRPEITEASTIQNGDRQFHLDPEQWLTLILLFELGEAFFALPVVWGDAELPEAVDRTLFVDVYGVLPNTTWCYVSEGGVKDGEVGEFIRARVKNKDEYVIHPKYIYGWKRHREELRDCSLGLIIRDEEELPIQEERRASDEEDFMLPTTQEFDIFRERINTIAGNGVSDSERRSWARNRLSDIIRGQQMEYRILYRILAEMIEYDWNMLVYNIILDKLQSNKRGFELESWGWIRQEFQNYGISDQTVSTNPESKQGNEKYIINTIDFKAAHELLDSVLNTWETNEVDPTRYRLGNARHAMLGS